MGEVARRLCTLLPAKQDNEGSYRSTVLPLKELFVGKKNCNNYNIVYWLKGPGAALSGCGYNAYCPVDMPIWSCFRALMRAKVVHAS